MTVDKDTIIGDILDLNAACEDIFFAFGMHCMGCPSARGETLEEACSIHGVDIADLLQGLREQLKETE